MKYYSSAASILAITLATSATVNAQSTTDHNEVEEIIVSSSPIQTTSTNVAQGISILTGEELDRLGSTTLGDTLDSLPGISQTAFGPSASRPIIRGLGGDRIRILIAGIGTIDASTTSVDHALALDPETAEKIEVLRGPATLLFGNNAAGGAINVFDGRIPTQLPEDGVEGQAKAEYDTNGNEFNTTGSVTFAAGDKLALHADISYLDRGDIDIPGFATSDALRAQLAAEGEEVEEEEGTVASTAQERTAGSFGASYIGETGFFGVNVSFFDNTYGLPVVEEEEEEEGGEGEEEGEEEGISIDQDQFRLDFLGEVESDFLIFEKTKFRFGYADYEHVELEGDEIGTQFSNEGWESRVEFVQKEVEGLKGAWGFQIRDRDFSAIGAEAFVPPSEQVQWGLFGLQQFEDGPLLLEAGLRFERQSIEVASTGFDRNFTGVSFSGSAIYRLENDWQVSVSGFRTERAPTVEELQSNGPHLATGVFEIGDPNLDEETAIGFELSIEKTDGPVTGGLNFFNTSYDDFIFEDFTGEIEDGLPVGVFTATNARFWGIEADFKWHAYEDGDDSFHINAGFDFVRATDTENDNPLPRIPAFSARVGGVYQSTNWDAYTTLEWTDSQNRVGNFQLPTDSFFDLTVGATFHPMGPEGPLHLYVEGKNLFDEEIRYATSFLAQTVPAPGARVRFGAKVTF
ncbi:TonB-dependent receptor [Kordiimonas sp. SCSIO 12610]|uniref:TonB-dependent receptor n=1 Tax=Kordiimonas sp. SCSIO 12610 TaxID=2829597 RepID=UPI00210E2744|nr:TonB-dependent receptor [Kordiimonas sp. SCSIO 12610]UTW54413.1 TonB-dependent receptor [Kordiimonas sp. SCSIO 12610]